MREQGHGALLLEASLGCRQIRPRSKERMREGWDVLRLCLGHNLHGPTHSKLTEQEGKRGPLGYAGLAHSERRKS